MLRGTFLSLELNDEYSEWFADVQFAVIASESSGASIRQILSIAEEGQRYGARECSSRKTREEARSAGWCDIIQTILSIAWMMSFLPSNSCPVSYSVAPRRRVLVADDGWFRPNDLLS